MDRIGKYQILEQVGQGAMGVVYKALDPLMERLVAIKTMSADLDAEPELRTRFFREARSAGKLSHKNIVTIHDLGEETNRAYMVMEFLDGEDLKGKITRRERMPLETKLRLMMEVCEGLAHAHNKDVVHRDIKPGNIHITRTGQVKIMDFGLARIASSEITRTGSVMGTPNYMSPEQVRGDRVDNRSDIFSAGATFYELLTYRKPFSGPTLHTTLFRILEQEPDPIESIDPAIPAELASIIQRSMAKEPGARYQRVDEMLRDLERFRKTLEERKRALRDEARRAVEQLDELVSVNKELLKKTGGAMEEAEQTAPMLLSRLLAEQEEDATKRLEFPLGYFELIEMRERAEREQHRLAAWIERYREAAPRVAEAARLAEAGKLEAALAKAQEILNQLPGHAEAEELARSVQEKLTAQAREQEKKRKLTALVGEAKDLSRKGELERSLKLLDEALGLAPEHSEAATLRQKVSERLEEKKDQEARAREAETLFQKATALVSKDEAAFAVEMLREALKLAPDHIAAAALLNRAQARLQQLAELAEKRREAKAALGEARKSLERGDFGGARKEVTRALEFDPEAAGAAEIREAIRRAEEEARAKEEREKKIRELLAEARRLFDAGKEEEAEARVAELLRLEAKQADGLALKKEIEERRRARERAEREKKERIARQLAQSRESEKAGDLEKALSLAEAALAEDGSHAEARELRRRLETDIEARRAREELDRKARELLTRAEELAGKGDYQEAATLLERTDSALGALPSVKQGLARYREAARVREEARERGRRIEAHFSEGQKAFARGEWAACEQEMNRVLALSPDHVQAPDYLARARQQLKEQREREDRQRKLAEAVAAAERALRAGELDVARREVERALSLEPSDADAGRLKAQVERRQTEIREERARRHKAEQLGTEAERLLNEGDVEGADRRLSEALSLWSDLPNAARLQKKIGKKLARVQTDATVAVSTLSGTRAPRAPVAPRPFPLKTLYLAAAMVGVVGLAAVLYFVLRPAPPAVGSEPIPGPAPVPGPTPPDPEIARGIEAATRALEAQDFATAAREARAVLERSSGNEEATRLLARAEESLSKIASGNRRAKELFDAGKHQEAMSVLTGVLKLAPSDPDARKLLSQLDQYARAGAEDALKQLREALSRAEQARAQTLAASPFEAAKALEAEGMRLYRAKQYGSATGKLFEAAEAYLRADSEARAAARAAEQERLRAAARSEAETARSRFEQARASAVSLGAEAKAAERFRQAAGLASDAQSRWAQGEFAEAKSGFEAATDAMRRAAEEASAADAATGQRQLEAARQAVDAAKRAVAGGDPRAAAEEASAEQLARQGRLADALAAYRRAAAAYQAAAQRGEADRQAVQALLARYTAAFESRDLGALKTVWPALAGSEEKKIKDFFDIARTLAVELQVTEVKIAGDSASVSCRRRVEMVARDGQKVASPETGIVFGLRRRGEGWVIESVQD
jgi:tetratricopeptide (TPR) repeat protein